MQLAVHANDRNTRNKWGHARVVSVACTMYPMFYMCTDDDYGTIVTSVNPCLGCPWLYFSGRTGHDRNEQSLQTCIIIGAGNIRAAKPRSREAVGPNEYSMTIVRVLLMAPWIWVQRVIAYVT